MYVPEGYTEKQLIDIIVKISRQLAAHFTFGYYDIEDLVQEGFIYAMECLPRFNPDNSSGCSLETFLKIHIRNRFINLQRDKYFRPSSPCDKCRHNDNGCQLVTDKSHCKKWLEWIKRNTQKKDLANSQEPQDTAANTIDIDTKLDAQNIIHYISEHLPANIRKDYLRMVEGCKLPKHITDKIRKIIIELLRDTQYEEWLIEQGYITDD